MRMQRPPAPLSYATVLFFYPSLSRLYCLNTWGPWRKYCHHRWRRKRVIWIESSRLWDLHSPRRLSSILTSRLAPGSEESWDKRAMLIQFGLKMGLRLEKQCEIRDCWANGDNNISDQAVALDRWSVIWADRAQLHEERWTLCLWHRCLELQCFPDVELLIWRCRPHHDHRLVPAVHIHPDTDSKDALRVYVYYSVYKWLYICSMICATWRSLQTFTSLCCIMMNKSPLTFFKTVCQHL